MMHEEIYRKLSSIRGAPTVVELLVEYAEKTGISDIHIDCDRQGTILRFRRQGILDQGVRSLACPHIEIIACFKVLAGIRTDEHTLSHDGRIRHVLKGGRSVDLRLSIIPTYHGENCVIRILREEQRQMIFSELGFSAKESESFIQALSHPQGCICVVGPTGSGKTTTLYSGLQYIQDQSRMLVTIEDPVEYEMEGVRQLQVSTRQGLTFAHGLRALLRQDPDVIMVGEIRDKDTAIIAMNASLTGHLVLTSLHAKDCASAFVRLADIGLDMALVASSLTLVIAQRLVRLVCDVCIGKGCTKCHGCGYEGRIGVYEFLNITEKVQDSLRKGIRVKNLETLRNKQGNLSLLEKANELIQQNRTTREEVARVFGTETF